MSTYTPIASVTLDSAQSSVTFSGIPQTYTDLVLVFNGGLASFNYIYVTFNSDTAANYSGTLLWGDGSSRGSTRHTNSNNLQAIGWATGIQNNANAILQINNYANTTTYKTLICRTNDAANGVQAYVGLWRKTPEAITSITLTGVSSTNISSGSTFNIYGVNAQLSAQAKAYGGDTITTDGTYWYHTFYSSGTFTPTQALTADYLVVAGGASGGVGGSGEGGGGGGAGGYRSATAQSFTNGTAYTVTVGAGGAGLSTVGARGIAGSNSSVTGTGFSTITASGGGTGGGDGNRDGGTGGSGGGGCATGLGGSGNSGSYSPVEGYAGGNGYPTNPTRGGGGGGGSSAPGTNGSTSGGAGGAGTSNSITGSSVTYAGGGGGAANSSTGGAGGSGGGGQGGSSTVGANGFSGTANTGSGGGGSYNNGTSGSGGSGIVIVRYAV